jgi:hypothetical protein
LLILANKTNFKAFKNKKNLDNFNSMIKNLLFAIGLVMLLGFSAKAQTGNGAIKISLIDNATKEAIPFANVVAYKDGVQVGVATTDMDGNATIKPLAPGKYTVKGVYVGYQAKEIKDVLVGDGKTAAVTIPLSNGEGVKLDEVEVLIKFLLSIRIQNQVKRLRVKIIKI